MKRRTFLRMPGIGPVAADVPAMVRPRPENVKETVKPTFDMDYAMGSVELEKAMILKDGHLPINLAHIKKIVGNRAVTVSLKHSNPRSCCNSLNYRVVLKIC
ncbi:hypothetical protein [Brucella sp. NBRC 12950]|uniref:hypothetical protein n=1 Tax=Brucella sp. NBRC 12950 TaxID=2994518 RepID=UPI0025523FCE|nr:hypothetical protein [Brucella sp. NBRC 12950]